MSCIPKVESSDCWNVYSLFRIKVQKVLALKSLSFHLCLWKIISQLDSVLLTCLFLMCFVYINLPMTM